MKQMTHTADYGVYDDMSKYEKIGDFLYLQGPGVDVKYGYPYIKRVNELSKLDNPPPFIHDYGVSVNIPTVSSARMWLMFEGNVGAGVCIPKSYFKNNTHVHLAPIIGSFAVRDAYNHFAPGKYFSKFPNDVVCKEHIKKNCGILFRRNGKYVSIQIGANIATCPSDDVLRENGLQACCLANHVEKAPSRREFCIVAAQKIIEFINKYDTPEKVMELTNTGFNEMGPKLYRIELNNPNANCEVDGSLWTEDHPNALFKGYLNGKEYSRSPWMYDDFTPDVDLSHKCFIKDFKEDKNKMP